MIKAMLAGVAGLFLLSAFVSDGHAWGAILWQISASVWLIYCFNKY